MRLLLIVLQFVLVHQVDFIIKPILPQSLYVWPFRIGSVDLSNMMERQHLKPSVNHDPPKGFLKIRGEYYSIRGLICLFGGLVMLICFSIDYSYGESSTLNIFQIKDSQVDIHSQPEHLRNIVHEGRGVGQDQLRGLGLLLNDWCHNSRHCHARGWNCLQEDRNSPVFGDWIAVLQVTVLQFTVTLADPVYI